MSLRTSLLLFLSTIAVFAGCGGDGGVKSQLQALNSDNMQKITSAYILYCSRNDDAPASKEELVSFIKTNDSIERNLDVIGISKEGADELFVNDRDGEDFVAPWGTKASSFGKVIGVVFEKTGVDGTRKVCLSNNTIVDVTSDKDYEALMAGKLPEQFKPAPDDDGTQ